MISLDVLRSRGGSCEANETADFLEFLSVMTRKMKVKGTKEELVGIFKVLNRDENDFTNAAESCQVGRV